MPLSPSQRAGRRKRFVLQRPARGTPPPRRRCAIEPHAGQEGCLVIVSWQRHRTGCRRSPVRTLPLPPVAFASVAPLCCDLRCCSRTVVVSKLRRTSAFFFFLVAAARPIFESEICSSLQVEAVEKLADGSGRCCWLCVVSARAVGRSFAAGLVARARGAGRRGCCINLYACTTPLSARMAEWYVQKEL